MARDAGYRTGWQKFATCVGLAGLATGCGSDLNEVRDVTSFSEGATLHVANEALVPYTKKIRDEMKPDFTLENSVKNKEGKTINSRGNAALEKVLPTTGYFEQQVIRALGASLAVNLATTTTKNETTAKSGGSEGSQVVVNNSTTYTSGAIPTVEQTKAGQTGMPSNAMSKIEAIKTDDEKRTLNQSDPLLQYNLAAALVQEVALLNNALDYIESIDSKTHVTFVMRLRVAVQPVAPNQPYNASVALGFFCVPVGSDGALDFMAAPNSSDGIVKVHPLLVVDDLAATSTARSAQLITQLSLAISGMVGSAGFGGLFSSNTSKIQSLLGKDLDSTFSISRTSDNTVTVRLGAPRQPTAGYAMINRNHTVSVILQVPRNCTNVNITAAASLRNAATGVAVPDPISPVFESMKSAFRRYLESYVDSKQTTDMMMTYVSMADLRGLADTIRPPNEAQFIAALKELLKKVDGAVPVIRGAKAEDVQKRQENFVKYAVSGWRSLWVVLNSKLSHSPYQNVSVSIPKVTVDTQGRPSVSGPVPTYSPPALPSSSPAPGGASPYSLNKPRNL